MGDGDGFDRDGDFGFDDRPGRGMGGGPPFRGRGGGGPPWRGMRGGPPGRGGFDNGFQRQGMGGPPRFRGGGRGFMGPPGPGPMNMRGGPGPMQRGGPPGGFSNRGGPPMRMFRPQGFDDFGGGPNRPGNFDDGRGPPHRGNDMRDGPNPMLLKEQLWAETPAGDGKSYFYHTMTRETTWERPTGPGVRIISHADWIVAKGVRSDLPKQQQGDGSPFHNNSQEYPESENSEDADSHLKANRPPQGDNPWEKDGGPFRGDFPPSGPGPGGREQPFPGREPFIHSQRPGGSQSPPGGDKGFRNPPGGPDPAFHNLRQPGPSPLGLTGSPQQGLGQVENSPGGMEAGKSPPQGFPGNLPRPGGLIPGIQRPNLPPGGMQPPAGQLPFAQNLGQQMARHPGPGGGMPFLGGMPPGGGNAGPGQNMPNFPQFMGGPPGSGSNFPSPFGMAPSGGGGYPSNFNMFPPPWSMAPAGVPPPVFSAPTVTDTASSQIEPKILAGAAEWSEHTSPEGKTYYFNTKTQQSVWEKPGALIELEGAKLLSQQNQQRLNPQPISQLNLSGQESKPMSGGKPETDTLASKTKESPKKPEAKKAGEKCRPISSTPVPGTPWCVVWTGDRRVFYYNPSNKQSIWDKPAELLGRMDVDEMIRACPDGKGGSKVKRVEATSTTSPLTEADKAIGAEGGGKPPVAMETGGSVAGGEKREGTEDKDNEQPPKKKPKKGSDDTKSHCDSEVVTIDDDDDDEGSQESGKGEGGLKTVNAEEAEIKAAKERAVTPLEERLKQFRQMLVEKGVSAFSTWEKELHKIVFDTRYLLLNSKERKQAFENYVKDRAEQERKEKRSQLKHNREQFLRFLKDAGVTSKLTYNEFASRHSKDDKFKLIEKQREREYAFAEYVSELRKKEKEAKAMRKERVREGLIVLLGERIKDYHTKWADVKKKLESESRFQAVEPEDREDIYYVFQRKLKRDTKATEKAKKKDKKDRRERETESRGQRGRKSSHGQHEREGSVTIIGDSPSPQGESTSKKDKEAETASDPEVLSVKSESTNAATPLTGGKAEEESPAGQYGGLREEEEGCITDDSDDEDKVPALTRMERVEISLREREREVQRSLAGHLRDRDKEREFHRHEEAIQEFHALLTDLVRNPDVTWKETKKVIKKDRRWNGVSILSRDEMEDIFIAHSEVIAKKKKQRFQELLADANVKLSSTWREVRKKIKNDPRFEKFSSSDRKCEREFDLYLKELSSSIKNDFRELLKETKMLSYKSKAQLKDNPGIVKDINSTLSKDKRYLQMDSMGEERQRLLLEFIDDLERKGPPPPPTASEPTRRQTKM